MKKKNIDRKEKLKKIGKIALTIFNVLTGIWFFISFICIIIAVCSGSLNTSGNNNGGGNRIIKDVSSSLIGNVSEVARPKYETRDSGDIEINADRNIGNDYNVDGIQNYNANYILTCYEDIDYSRTYHLFMREQYLKETLRNIALNVQESFTCYIKPSQKFVGPLGSNVDGFSISYYTSTSDGITFYHADMCIHIDSPRNVISYTYDCFFDNDTYSSFYENFNYVAYKTSFDKLFLGNIEFYFSSPSHITDLGIYYFSEYSIHDIGMYFNTGSLTGNFGIFEIMFEDLGNNILDLKGTINDPYWYAVVKGVFRKSTSDVKWSYLVIRYKRITNYVFDIETRQMLFNPSSIGEFDNIYIPDKIGLSNHSETSYLNNYWSVNVSEIVSLNSYWSSQNAYLLGIENDQNIPTIIIHSLFGEYLVGGDDGVLTFFTMFYALKNQCAFVNGFYFYIDPNGNVHTGLTGSATGGDISSSYIGDVFKLINQILTSFTGFFGYYLLPGVSIGLLFALPLIFTIILFVVKLFKR